MKKIIPLILILCLFLSGCGETTTTKTVFAMDTVMNLTVYDTGAMADLVLSDCSRELFRLEKLLSVTDEDSEIARFNAGDKDALSEESSGLIIVALASAFDTEGAYDPTVYPLMKLWGFYNDEFTVPTEAELSNTLLNIDYTRLDIFPGSSRKIYMPQGMGVDLGGIAKGYAAKNVLEIMRAGGVETAVISLGGNVGLLGTKPDGTDWQVAIERPDGSGEAMAQMSIPGGEYTYVVTSGGYQRNFTVDGVTYHHILDPDTGRPAETDLLSVTIISDDGILADAYSTALFVMGREKAIEFWKDGHNEYDFVLYDGTNLYVTPGVKITADIPVVEVTE